MESKKDDFNFEEAIAEIEGILRALENKNLDLDTAIKLYERGIRLIQVCEEKLKNARTKIEVILKDEKGIRLEGLEKAFEIIKNGS